MDLFDLHITFCCVHNPFASGARLKMGIGSSIAFSVLATAMNVVIIMGTDTEEGTSGLFLGSESGHHVEIFKQITAPG